MAPLFPPPKFLEGTVPPVPPRSTPLAVLRTCTGRDAARRAVRPRQTWTCRVWGEGVTLKLQVVENASMGK